MSLLAGATFDVGCAAVVGDGGRVLAADEGGDEGMIGFGGAALAAGADFAAAGAAAAGAALGADDEGADARAALMKGTADAFEAGFKLFVCAMTLSKPADAIRKGNTA